MTKEAKTTDTKPKGGKTKTIILIVVGLIITLGGGIGAGLYVAGNLSGPGKEEDPNRPKLVERGESPPAESEPGKEPPLKEGTVSVSSDAEKIDPKKYEATYFSIEQNMTANLANGQGFVQIGISLSTYYDGKVISNIKRQIVPIRSAVLMVLSQQDGTVLATPQGKAQLQVQLTEAINRVLRQKEGFGGVDNVYFTSLVVQ
jgi:flagellar protein FliL